MVILADVAVILLGSGQKSCLPRLNLSHQNRHRLIYFHDFPLRNIKFANVLFAIQHP